MEQIRTVGPREGTVAHSLSHHAQFIIPDVIENEHEKRHWDSFRNSMKEWTGYAPGSGIGDDVYDEIVRKVYEKFCQAKKSGSVGSKQLMKIIDTVRKDFKCTPSKSGLALAFNRLIALGEFSSDDKFSELLVKKQVRSSSGVLVITVLTAPGPFSCPKDCHYCPNEPGQPRSYLSTEPAVLRANQNGWDAVSQFDDRAETLENNGHTVDKIEILVLGGTWSGYPRDYQEEFIRDLFYAANTFDSRYENRRSPLSLQEEQTINEMTKARIIGLTLETRPDHINRAELRNLRYFGCTRVQIGVQHTNDDILRHINRGCEHRHTVSAIKMLKDSGFKVDIHLMPDLPSSTVEKDMAMFDEVLKGEDVQADQWKIYPCEVTPFSTIEKWWKEGKYIPYTDKNPQDLLNLLIDVKSQVHPWIRLNRVVRDIPNPSIIAGNLITNLRQDLERVMHAKNLYCKCIRCREVRAAQLDASDVVLKERRYRSSGGDEVFLSFETEDEKTILGFLRLRLRNMEDLHDEFKKGNHFAKMNELAGAALIREVHVYGVVVGVDEARKGDSDFRPQHLGLGRKLLERAEELAREGGYPRVAIISGIGAREYYRKNGYALEGTYMVKTLEEDLLQMWRKKFGSVKPAVAPKAVDREEDAGIYCETTADDNTAKAKNLINKCDCDNEGNSCDKSPTLNTNVSCSSDAILRKRILFGGGLIVGAVLFGLILKKRL